MVLLIPLFNHSVSHPPFDSALSLSRWSEENARVPPVERKLTANLITCIHRMHVCSNPKPKPKLKRCGNSCNITRLAWKSDVPHIHFQPVSRYLYGNIVNYPMIYDVRTALAQRYGTPNQMLPHWNAPWFVVMCVCLYGGNEWMQAKPIITYYYIITGGINLIFCIAFVGIAHSISIPPPTRFVCEWKCDAYYYTLYHTIWLVKSEQESENGGWASGNGMDGSEKHV